MSDKKRLFTYSGKIGVTRQLQIVAFLLFFLLAGGVSGYVLIERWSVLESLYMTVITVTTVGLTEVRELSTWGRLFTVLLIIIGVGIWAYILASFSELLVEGELREYFSTRKLKKMINRVSDHTILCGYGRIGCIVAHELAGGNRPFLIIEKDPSMQEEFEKSGYLYLIGDATNEEVLKEAGIHEARCLISALGSDADNVYTVLIARDLNPRLYIVGRGEDEMSEDKIIRAGADKVISPYLVGARGLAQAVMRPYVLNFIELASSTASMELAIEEIVVPENASIAGQTLKDARIRERFGLIIIGSRLNTNDMEFNPNADYVIREGEVLIAMGKKEGLQSFRSLLEKGA